MRYDAVLFDLDGTLTESEPGIKNCVKYAVEKMGFPPLSEDVLRKFIGPPLVTAFCEYCGMTREQAEQATACYRERFDPIGWKENSVYPDIAPLLRTLHKRGAYVALATSKPDRFTQRILDYFGLAHYVDKVVATTLKDGHTSKQELIARALPEKYERACMVGDRRFDMEGAKLNGIDALGVLYGYGSRGELEQAGATRVLESVAELSEYLLDGEAVERGWFISFEGGDGCGKSTQMERLADYMKRCGWPVRLSREPGGCPISERIRDILLDVGSEGMTSECEALLYAASRAQHVRQVILPALERGEVVLCDRYLDSSLVYQGIGRGLGMDEVARINQPATAGLLPDLTLWYDLEPEVAMARRAKASELDRMEREQMPFFRAVREGYRQLARQSAERICVLNAEHTIEELEGETRGRVLQLLAR